MEISIHRLFSITKLIVNTLFKCYVTNALETKEVQLIYEESKNKGKVICLIKMKNTTHEFIIVNIDKNILTFN